MIELYKDKYPTHINKPEIEETINKIFKNFRSPFNEKEKSFLRKLLINALDKEIFTDERTYYFNLKTSINIPLLIKEPESFIRNSKNINKFVIWIISRKIDPDFSKKCEIEEQGKIVDLKTQLLARYKNNYCSISVRDLIYFSERLNKLNHKDRNKFLMGLDNWLFPRGNCINISSFYTEEALEYQSRYHSIRHKPLLMMVILVFCLYFLFA